MQIGLQDNPAFGAVEDIMRAKMKVAVKIAAGTITAAAVAAGLIFATFINGKADNVIQLEGQIQAGFQSGVMTGGLQENDDPLTYEEKSGSDALSTSGKTETESETSGSDKNTVKVFAVNVKSLNEIKSEKTPLDQYFEDKAVVNGNLVDNSLNIRSVPEESGDSNILTAVGADTILQVLEQKDGWTCVSIDSTTGWAKSEYLLTGDKAAAYVEEHAEPYAEVTVPNMNIRMGKSLSADILDVAYEGEAYPLLEIEDGWAHVQIGDVLTGYLAGNCVTINYVWNGMVIATEVAGAEDHEVIDIPQDTQIGGESDWTAPTVILPGAAEAPAETPGETPQIPGEIPTEVPQTPGEIPTQAPQTPDAPTAEAPSDTPAVSVIGIEAFYNGSVQKVEGEVLGRSEVCVFVYYSDGSTQIVSDGWTSNDIGMILHAGQEIITIEYAGFTSNIVLEVLPAPTQAPTETPGEVPTEAPTETPGEVPTQAPTETPGEIPTQAPTEAPTEAPAETPTEAPAEEEAYVKNVPLSGKLTAYTLRLCSQYGVDSSVIFSVMYQESRFNPNAVSGSGAIGLMQIIPRYSQERMSRLGVTDLYDPASNILVGVDMLAEFYHTYGSWVCALTQYRYGTPNGPGDYASLILSRTSMFQN